MTETAPPSPAAPAPAAPPPRRHRAWRWLAGVVGVVCLLVAALVGTVWWAAHSAEATAWLLARVPGLKVTAPKGALLGDFSASQVELNGADDRHAAHRRPRLARAARRARATGLEPADRHRPPACRAGAVARRAERGSGTTEAARRPAHSGRDRDRGAQHRRASDRRCRCDAAARPAGGAEPRRRTRLGAPLRQGDAVVGPDARQRVGTDRDRVAAAARGACRRDPERRREQCRLERDGECGRPAGGAAGPGDRARDRGRRPASAGARRARHRATVRCLAAR